jgi:hypothetical protein
MADATATPPTMGDAYTKVEVTFDEDQPVNRLWGIPVFGYLVRWLALIPHALVLWVAGILLGLSVLVSWIPVLLTGRQPLAGFYRWYFAYTSRVWAWGFFLAAPWPPILGDAPDYPVQVTVPTGGRMNQLWGIPYLGILVRALLLIPHGIVAAVYTFVVYLFAIVLWIPILVNGRVPHAAYAVIGGLIRLQVRIATWYLLCPVSYPPLIP